MSLRDTWPERLPRKTKLAEVVEQSGLRQYQFAGGCFIHPTTFGEYMRGVRPIPSHHLLSICRFIELEPETIVGYVEESDNDD